MAELLDCRSDYIPARGMGGALEPSIIVVHSAETPELLRSAEGVAGYFATGTTSSTHATTDVDSIPQSVPLDRVCYGTGEGGVNGFSWQIEQAGIAAQDRSQWLDPYSRATIVNTATVIKEMIRRRPAIRPVFLDAAALRRGERWGITSHGEVHAAWPQGDGRTDPGAEYPWDVLLAMVRSEPTADDLAAFYAMLADLEDIMARPRLAKLDPAEGNDPTAYLCGATTKSKVEAVAGRNVIAELRVFARVQPPPVGPLGPMRVDNQGVELWPKWMLDQLHTV